MRPIEPDPYRGDTLHDQLFVKVFSAASVTIDRDWNSANVRSGYWRLYLNRGEGAALRLADGSLFRLTADVVHLVPAGVGFSCVNRARLRHHFVHFDLIGMVATWAQQVFTKPLSVATALLAPLPDEGFDGAEDVAICRAKALVYGALAVVFREHTAMRSRLSDVGRLAPAVRHIEAHLGARITNRELAARCHMSEDHFGRIFRARLGQTPAQYLIDRRVATATQALAFTGDSIEQIAERLGFANRFHFTRMFSRRMGIPPAAYRRRARV